MIDQPFERKKFLGKGGFAETWLVEIVDEFFRSEFGVSECVIKIPLDRRKEMALAHELEMASIVHQQLKDLKSFNIVRYIGFASFEGKIVMVMDYARDGSLRDKIGEPDFQQKLPLSEALDITEQVLEALLLIHSQNIIHRDVKPENIMFDMGVVKICDLGIARFLKTEEMAYTVTGSPLYMAPEIYQKKGATFSTDLWSLGVCLYEMLTGELPFGGRHVREMTIDELKDDICNAQHREPQETCQDVSKEINNLICRALDKDPAKRFQSAAEMLRMLRLYRQIADDPLIMEITAIREQMGVPGKYYSVEARLQKLATLFPDDLRVYRYLGELYNRCQRYTDAITAFKKGLNIAPDNADLYWNLFLSYQKKKQHKNAEAAFLKATEYGLDPSLQRYGEMLLQTISDNQ